MRLGEAFQIIAQSAGDKKMAIHLLCAFTPLHLETFVRAYLALRLRNTSIAVPTGLYGDLDGNLQRARDTGGEGAIVVIEWSDLDQRLGLRASAGWRTETLDDIVTQVEEKCRRIETHLLELGRVLPVVVAPPTLALPPITHVPSVQLSDWELRLSVILAETLQRLACQHGIRLLNSTTLATISPLNARHDVKMDLHAGFPYTASHADALAKHCVQCLFPTPAKKGIITDLDQTLWKGVVGDAGVDGVSWSLEGHSQAHALYQQLLASLADSGVLVAIASKNDPKFAGEALHRPDILVPPSKIFPVEISWGPKSEAVARILQAWNISADSVVFVDDSAMELAQVAEKHPGIECMQFPSGDPGAVLALLWQLRGRFGKSEILEEDRLRLASIRGAAARAREDAPESSADFLSRIEAKVTFDAAGSDPRAFELVNKTNQFNLNGVRYTEAEWKSLSRRPGAFLATVSYEDRFGPLGRIAVLGGYKTDNICHVDVWVMSCRAFSRQIEFQSIRQLFHESAASEIRFRFRPTDRNGPLQTFFQSFSLAEPSTDGQLHLSLDEFERNCPPLFHQVTDKWMMSEKN